jgi:methanogenic corrinoid protein MtbC1
METAARPSFAEWHSAEREDGQLSRRGAGRSRGTRVNITGERLESLTQTLAAQVIPRLMLVHKSVSEQAIADAAQSPNQAEVAELTCLVMRENAAEVSAYVARIKNRGVPLESIYLDLLAPVARRLGELWDADRCDFTSVTIGTGHLQQVMRELGRSHPIEIDYASQGKRAVFAPTPGDQHTLGLVMITELFSNAGWDICPGPAPYNGALAALVKSQWVDLIGLSVSSEAQLDLLAERVSSSKRASLNRAVIVMVGGPLFVSCPELAQKVGADVTAVDGRQALASAEHMMLQLRAGI